MIGAALAALAAISLAAGPSAGDGRIGLAGLRHDSRDLFYRAPGGAVPAGTSVRLRLRTFAGDVSSVRLRLYDVDASKERFVPMRRVARRASCRQRSLARRRCDVWQTIVESGKPNTLWYRFVVRDGRRTVYYDDDTAALDGGLGEAYLALVDRSWALTVYAPGFATPSWTRDAVVYQIFPDRFRNGDPSNDPRTGDPRYDDPVLARPWSALPEGYCRGYETSGCGADPRGRDYYGGDLAGVIQELDYLKRLGVTAISLNPIFRARSNHRYDTVEYGRIDPYLGDLGTFAQLVAEARARGMRVILDGVFNHMSSDSPAFDRYHRYPGDGACESASSAWRPWFVFTGGSGPCAGGGYRGWADVDTLPLLNKSNPDVRDFFLGPSGVARLWLARGAGGWRLDVMGDPSFPPDWWAIFRKMVKAADLDALVVGELWQKDTTLLGALRGDEADGVMNYRLRDAVLGLLAPSGFDAKGFPDSGQPIAPSRFAARVASIYEDYPRPAWDALENLLDSHDTERALWTLTPGPETRAAKEENAANVAAGKARLRLASLLQFTLPGMPTVYYGDEAGVTGDDDPDDRRTYPWPDAGGRPDEALLAHYRLLGRLRHELPALMGGDLRFLLANDRAGVVAYARVAPGRAAVVAVNRSRAARTVDVPVADVVANGTPLADRYGTAGTATVSDGRLRLTLPPLGAALLAAG